MGLFEQFPYTNFHELNLDWILKNQKSVINELQNIDGHIAQIVNEYLQNVEFNAMYVPDTETIVLNFDEQEV